MSKKLLITVLTLGLLFTASGVVLGSDNPGSGEGLTVQNRSNPNAPNAQSTQIQQPALQRPIDLDEVAVQGALFPPAYYCDFIDYSGGNFTNAFGLPQLSGLDWFNMRHTAAKGYACTLLTAYIAVYPAFFVGTPNLSVKVWDDDGFGHPGLERANVVIPYASLPTSPGYVPVDFSSYNLVYGSDLDDVNYYIGVTSTTPGTRVYLLSDNGSFGTGRSGFYYNDADPLTPDWYNFAAEGMLDYNFLIASDFCCGDIPYTKCYTQSYFCGITSYFPQPSPYGTDYYNTRFSTEGPETLVNVGIALYAGASTGNPDLEVFVRGSVGGFPDMASVIYTTTVPYASIVWYPGWTEVAVPNIVIPPGTEFHVVGSAAGTGALAFLMDNGTCGTLRSSLDFGGWYLNADVFGPPDDPNWAMFADLCKDEFAQCVNIADYGPEYFIYSMPHTGGNGRVAGYQMIEPMGIGCRLEKIRVLTDNPIYYGYPAGYQYDAQLEIRSDNAGAPDAQLTTPLLIPAGTMAEWPAYNEWDVSALNILFDQPIWVGIRSLSPTPYAGPDFFLIADDGTVTPYKSVGQKFNGSFVYYAVNFIINANVCCIPPAEIVCSPTGDDWVTSGHDFRRTSHSLSPTGDAKCKQSLAWMANDPSANNYTRPIIYDGVLLVAFANKLRAYDINSPTGTVLWTKSGLPYIGTTPNNSVTVKDGFVYFGGGSNRGMTKADVYTGAVVWSRNITSNPLTGNTVFTTSVILDCGGTEVIIFGTAAGAIYALDCLTGLDYAGWSPNPVMVNGDPLATLSSNGVDVVYVGTNGIFEDGEGTLYAIDACTGTVLWTLGYPDLFGATLSAVDPPGEILQGPIAVDVDGSMYFTTAFNNYASSTNPTGAYYKVADDGSIVWGKGYRFARYTGPVLDVAYVTITALRGWSSDPYTSIGAKKSSGDVWWESTDGFDAVSFVEGAMSCEPNAPDKLYMGNRSAQFLCINAEDGTVEFEYNYASAADPANRGCGTGIDASHVVFLNRKGDVYVMTTGAKADRPRLRILKFDEFATVPFFSPPSFVVTFEDVFMNNGCANLTGTITADENPPAAYAWTVDPERISRMQKAARNLVDFTYEDMARNMVKGQRIDNSDADFNQSAYSKDSYSNMAAYGQPAWLNSIVTDNFDLAPGETFDVVYDVNGPLVSRGPHFCYVTINSNDQYFLNSTNDPAVQLGVLGGCLQVDDVIAFGPGEANEAPVFNTGELGNQSGAAAWSFDGETNRYWQGGLFFAVDQQRMAWTTDSWHGADPDNFHNSLLPDPNCFDQCEPFVTPDKIILAYMSHDGGVSYDAVEGYAAASAYVDSVVDYDCYGSGWDWGNVTCPYDNALTMGFRVEQFAYAAVDEAGLNNVVVFRHDVTNRNAAPITDLYVGAFHDYDLDGSLNGFDTYRFDAAHSISWGSPCVGTYDFTDGVVYGNGKLPISPDPMLGARTCDANQTMWEANYVGLDSLWYWMKNVPGQTAQAPAVVAFPCGAGTVTDDRDQFASFAHTTIAGNATYSFGTFMFGFAAADVTDDQRWFDLAILVNKFAGFGRGDINDDGVINLVDVVALWNNLHNGGPGPLFLHLSDVNNDGNVDNGDVLYLANFYFCQGPAPVNAWALPNICP